MFHKKKFTLVEEKNEKKMYNAKNIKWLNYLIVLALTAFVLLMILANVKSKSYYQNLDASKKAKQESKIRSILQLDEISSRALDCSNRYCSVTCSGDMTDLKNYLNNQKSCTSMTLTITDGTFPDARLQTDWLQGSFSLSCINITQSTLRAIDSGAFTQISVVNMNELKLDKVQLSVLTEDTFIGLNALTIFTLVNEIEVFCGDTFLKPMERTLAILTINHVSSTATDPGPWLRGGDYPKLYAIYFENNNFGGYITTDTFQHLKALTFLSMGSSKINYLPDGVFDFMMKQSFVFIFLQKNELKRIAGNYLTKVRSLWVIFLYDNPWDCTCELEQLIREFKRYPEGFGDTLICSTPSQHADKAISAVVVDPCEVTTTALTTTPSSTTKPMPITTSSSSTTEVADPPVSTEPPLSSTTETPPTSTITSTTTTLSPTSNSTPASTSSSSTAEVADPPVSTEPPPSSTTETPPSSTTISTTNPTESTVPTISTESSSSTQQTTESSPTTLETTTSYITDSTASSTTALATLPEDEFTSPSPQTTPSPQNRTTTMSADQIVSIECQRYNSESSSGLYIELSRPDTHFYITSLSETSAQLTMEPTSDDLALIWFYDQPMINGSGENIRIVGEFKVGCQSELDDSLLIEGLARRRAYTFCLVKEGVQVVPPFNCISYYTSEGVIGGIDEREVWLKYDDKALTIGLFVFGIIISICIGVVGMFLVLRAQPTLLKGSKRVIVVNRSTGDVLVMPRPGCKSSTTESSYRDSYETNTTIRQRRFSETSIQSGRSYMMANNYEDIEYRWKMNVVNDMIYANRVPKSPPPPLPKRTSQETTLTKAKVDQMKIAVVYQKENDYGYIA